MPRKILVVGPSGKEQEATELDIEKSIQAKNEVILSDGTIFRINPSILGVVVLDGEWDENGNPLYQIAMQVDIVVSNVPEDRRRAD